MPFYEYQCGACGHHVEVLQKISDGPLKKCPNCGKQKLQRLISAPVFRLKGSGWYETDFKSDNESKRNLAGQADKESKDATAVDATVKPPEAKPAETKEAAKPAEKAPAETKSRSTAKVGKTAKPKAKAAPAKRKAARR